MTFFAPTMARISSMASSSAGGTMTSTRRSFVVLFTSLTTTNTSVLDLLRKVTIRTHDRLDKSALPHGDLLPGL